jgi:malonyl-CoA/methylmalonyl-CoA synthetase
MSSNQSLFATIESRLPQDPATDFIIRPDGRRFSYGDMLQLSARCANALRALGVQPGDRVAVQVDKSLEALMLYLGTLRTGAVYLPLNTAYTGAELSYFLEDAEPVVFICRPQFREQAEQLAQTSGGGDIRVETLGVAGDGSFMQQVGRSADTFANVARASDDLAAILYTSGTTGRSKGAMLTHGNLASNAEVLTDYWRFSAGDRLLHALPIFHTHGLFVATNVVMLAGAAMILMQKFDIDELLRLLPRANVLMGVPTFYTRLLARDEVTRESMQHMRVFISGSAPLTAEVHKAFAERTGHAILERYGMTETGMNTSNPYDQERIAGTVGFPLPGISIRISDPESQSVKELPRGEVGMIEVRGPNVFKGYWRMPEKTAEELRGDGFFITGDLGFVDERGYLHIVGRGKDLIISGGFNVYPKEIEMLIDELPGVAESAVIGVPHPDFGEGVVAVVVPASDAGSLDEQSILRSLADRLAKYKTPKRVFFVDALPRNVMGKVQKNELREQYQDACGG